MKKFFITGIKDNKAVTINNETMFLGLRGFGNGVVDYATQKFVHKIMSTITEEYDEFMFYIANDNNTVYSAVYNNDNYQRLFDDEELIDFVTVGFYSLQDIVDVVVEAELSYFEARIKGYMD